MASRRTKSLAGFIQITHITQHEFNTRTWKTKLTEWKFDKYLIDKEGNNTTANAKKRRREEETAIFHNAVQVSPSTLDNSKKRKVENGVDVTGPNPGESFTALNKPQF